MESFDYVRELGESEYIYDFEYKLNRHLFVSSIFFESQIDIINLDKSTFIKSVYYWKLLNPLLRANIICIENKKYFKLIENKLDESQLDNINLLNLTVGHSNIEYYWRLLYEREFNIEPSRSPLWRLYIVHLNKNKYSLILNIHHALTDARNKYNIMSQFLNIICMIALDKNYKLILVKEANILGPVECLSKQIYGDNLPTDNLINQFDDDFCKISIDFRQKVNPNKIINENKEKFEYVLKKSNPIWIKDLEKRDINATKFFHFRVDQPILKELLKKCQLNKMKLSGCLNMINILATHLTYLKFCSLDNKYTNEIYYHLMVSLRPYLHLDYFQMGFYASCLNFKFKFENHVENLDEFLSKKFWVLAQYESDQIHMRLSSNEHIKNGIGADKNDSKSLLNNIEKFCFSDGGGVHFAISNLGLLTNSFSMSNLIKINQFNYQISMDQNRWSSIIFNGISTCSDHLDWGITFNSNSIREEIIGYKLNLIKEIFYKLI